MSPDSQVVSEPGAVRVDAEKSRRILTEAARIFASKPFYPHPLFRSGHAQTLAGYVWPRRFRLRASVDKERLFQVAPTIRVLAHCRWQSEPRNHPTIVAWHGIEGSSDSIYMLETAQKAFQAGFNVVRMNLRNCGDTDHLSDAIYHGGLTEDLRAVVEELIERDHLTRIFALGFSLGGNMILKLAGEYADSAPKELVATVAVSPSVDLNASANAINLRSNRIYQQDFVKRLKRRVKVKAKLYPQIYDASNVHLVRTLREFDDRYTARAHGFLNADDYYYKASALRVIDRIKLPTLIIHAQDDPFIPFAPLRDPVVSANPNILLLAPEHGGHVAFISSKPRKNFSGEVDTNRFWAENRVVEFCKLASESF
jgi:predicted alpha/beta-fold hydrolase